MNLAVSFNFLYDFTLFVTDMHQIMLISLFSTSFDHFHFHGFLKSDRMVILKSCLIIAIQGHQTKPGLLAGFWLRIGGRESQCAGSLPRGKFGIRSMEVSFCFED